MFLLSDLPRPLVRYIIGVWRRRWLILFVGWVLALAGWTATTFIPDIYKASSQIYLNTNTALRSVADEAGAGLDYEKQVRVIRGGLLTRENLTEVIIATGMDAEIEATTARERLVAMERIVDSMRERIVISTPIDQVFVVEYYDEDPRLAQQVVATLVDLMIEKDIGAQLTLSEEAIAGLDGILEERRRQLEEIEAELAQFRATNKEALAGGEQLLRELQLREAELDRIDVEIASASRRRDSYLSQLAVTPAFSSGNELDQLKVELAALRSQYNEDYPDIANIKARIAELEQAGAALPDNPEYRRMQVSLRLTEDELRDLRARRAAVRRELNSLTERSVQVPEVENQLKIIMRNYDTIDRTYNELLAKRSALVTESQLNERGGTIDYTIQEAATLPKEPDNPPRGLMSLAIPVLTLGFGGALAFLLAQIDRTFIHRNDVEEAFGLQVIGTISPSLTPAYRRAKFLERLGLAAASIGIVLMAGVLFWFYEIRVPGEQPLSRETLEVVRR